VAENFVVSAYIEDVRVFTQTVAQLNPQASITLQWDQVFAAAGFYPVKVVIDETNVLDEDNELNNFAIRPILTGDYQLPGGIEPTATAAPLTLLPNQSVTITGRAQYFGIDPGVNPDVAGATVIARITGGGQASTTTFADGSYSLSVRSPGTAGTYALNIEVTDYTLTGYQGPITITVLPAPPRPDLSTFISLNKTTILPGESVSGTVLLQNVGDAVATNFLFRYFNCDQVLDEEVIASLAPGESRTYTFTTTTNVIGDCFNRNNCLFRSIADVNNVVTEKTKTNNQSSANLTVLPDKPDLTPINTTNGVIPGNVNMLNPFTFSVRVDNIGGVNATTPFTVNVYIDDVLIRTQPFPSLNSCEGNTFSVTHNFADINDKVLTIKVDEPIGSGSVDEYRETNNEYSKIIRHVPPPPQFPNLNIANRDISVTPVLPAAGTNFDLTMVYRNTSQQAITAPFNIEMTVTESGVPRIETQTINETILPGTSRSINLTTSLATDGDHAIRVRLDADNIITESSEGDNTAQMPLCVDFQFSSFGGAWGGNFYVNTPQNFSAGIFNTGLFTATDVLVSFFVDDVKIGSSVIPVLGPGNNSSAQSVAFPYLFSTVGSYEVKMVIDEPNAYTECREDNNSYVRTITVLEPRPDVRIFSEYISPSKINPDVNEPITIFISYDNVGVGASGAFKARILVDDVPLGSDVDIPSVAAGDDGTVEVPTPYASSTAGIRVIRAILDPDNQLNETSKTNNQATRALVVGKAPNLIFTDLQANVNCPDDGADVILTASLHNAGDLQATADVFFFYIAGADTIPIDNKRFTLAGKESLQVQTEWLVINKTFDLYAEIRNSDPMEYDESDNFIRTKLCGGPYFNLFVEAEGKGIIQKTPNQNRFEGAQSVTITAIPASGWIFAGWQGDATGTTNPLTINLGSDQTIMAVFNAAACTPVVISGSRCGTGSVTLRATGAEGAQQYAWFENQDDQTPFLINSTGEFVTPELSATRTYYVRIQEAGGCISDKFPAIAEVTILSAPLITTPSNAGFTFCAGESITLQGPPGFFGYQWSNNLSGQSITVTAAGTYSLVVTDNTGCTSAPASIVVTENPSPNAIITYSNDRLVAGPAASYQWFNHGVAIPGAKSNTLEINFLQYGVYTVRMVSTENCVAISDPFVYLITGPETDPQTNFVLYPNPTAGKISMRISSDTNVKKWIITDAFGRQMAGITGEKIEDLDISNWASGIYTVVVTSDEKIFTQKFIKL
jgi:subtilase family serine protease